MPGMHQAVGLPTQPPKLDSVQSSVQDIVSSMLLARTSATGGLAGRPNLGRRSVPSTSTAFEHPALGRQSANPAFSSAQRASASDVVPQAAAPSLGRRSIGGLVSNLRRPSIGRTSAGSGGGAPQLGDSSRRPVAPDDVHVMPELTEHVQHV